MGIHMYYCGNLITRCLKFEQKLSFFTEKSVVVVEGVRSSEGKSVIHAAGAVELEITPSTSDVPDEKLARIAEKAP